MSGMSSRKALREWRGQARAVFKVFRTPAAKAGGALAVAIAAGLITWLLVDHNGGQRVGPAGPALGSTSAPASASTSQGSRLPLVINSITLSAKLLKALASSLGQPVYWAGPESGHRYELRRTNTGAVFVRYLPRGVKAGDDRQFLTVGTYPYRGAFAATQALASEPGAVSRRFFDGRVSVYRRNHPVSVYIAYPNLNYQIEVEVFDPSPAQARAFSERVRRLS
jgi:hypothetical protein